MSELTTVVHAGTGMGKTTALLALAAFNDATFVAGTFDGMQSARRMLDRIGLYKGPTCFMQYEDLERFGPPEGETRFVFDDLNLDTDDPAAVDAEIRRLEKMLGPGRQVLAVSVRRFRRSYDGG